MLLFSVLPFFILSISCAFAKDEDPHTQLVALAAEGNGVIKLNEQTYKLLTAPTRTWSSTVQLTALKSFKCPPCKELDPVFKIIGQSWTKVPRAERDQHFFATLDFEDGQTTFRTLGLSSAPAILVHPAAKGPRRPANGVIDGVPFDFSSSGFDPAALADQLSRHTPVRIPYKAPPNYALFGTILVSAVTFAIAARVLLPLLLSRWFWAAGTIITSLVMVGGFMFVRIRGMPYVAAGRNGGAQMIAAGFQSQYGIEVQIIAFMYGLLSLSFLVLTVVIPRNTSPSRQRFSIYLWNIVTFMLFSILLSLYRIKNGGYPFRLIF